MDERDNQMIRLRAPYVYEGLSDELSEDEKIEIAEQRWELENER